MMSYPEPIPQDRKRLSPEERRTMIVSGATAYLSEVGLEWNTRELSKRLGITQSLIFKYFDTKSDLLEAVYRSVYLDRVLPDWADLIIDRRVSINDRTVKFYSEYSDAIFSYEWMRIFMFSGLAGAELNHRYLVHLSTLMLEPLLEEILYATKSIHKPVMEDIWNLHGGIVYIGIRRFVYQMPHISNDDQTIRMSVERFLRYYEIDIDQEVSK